MNYTGSCISVGNSASADLLLQYNNSEMEKIASVSSGELYVDKDNTTLIIKLFGKIKYIEFQMLYLKVEQYILENDIENLIEDRSEVFDYPQICLRWYNQNFLTRSLFGLSSILKRLTIVKSGALSDDVQNLGLQRTLGIVAKANSNLQLAMFSSFDKAMDWTYKDMIDIASLH